MDQKDGCKTFEDVLIDRLMRLTNAIDEENGDIFDRTCATMEIWMKCNIPKIYNEIYRSVQPLTVAVQNALQKINKEAAGITSQYAKEAFRQKESYTTIWDYRNKYFELVLGVLGNYGFIPYTMDNHADITDIEKNATKKTDVKLFNSSYDNSGSNPDKEDVLHDAIDKAIKPK